jgi:hypothetical protein
MLLPKKLTLIPQPSRRYIATIPPGLENNELIFPGNYVNATGATYNYYK